MTTPAIASQNLGHALGFGRLRRHRMLPDNKELLGKFPKHLGESEYNVAFGLGSFTAGAAGNVSYNVNAPRDVILRRLFISAGSVRGRITGFQVGGENVVIGSSMPIEAFANNTIDSPEFDFYAKAGTPVAINVTLDAAYTIDAGFAID